MLKKYSMDDDVKAYDLTHEVLSSKIVLKELARKLEFSRREIRELEEKIRTYEAQEEEVAYFEPPSPIAAFDQSSAVSENEEVYELEAMLTQCRIDKTTLEDRVKLLQGEVDDLKNRISNQEEEFIESKAVN